MDRMGLVGAMPVGNRWRAQGHLDGSVKYLGTFDTEEEAHAVFMAARQAQEAAESKARASEIERLLTGPTYTYKGGVGRGAALNGRQFKIVEPKDAHSTVVVELRPDGVIDLNDQRVVLNAYLEAVPATPARAAALTVEPTPTAPASVQEDLARFVGSGRDVLWALEFVERHAREPLATSLAHLRGIPDLPTQLEWLRVHTTLPEALLQQFETEHLTNLWDTAELKRQVDAVETALGR